MTGDHGFLTYRVAASRRDLAETLDGSKIPTDCRSGTYVVRKDLIASVLINCPDQMPVQQLRHQAVEMGDRTVSARSRLVAQGS
jgi:hypothetical protein